MNIIIMVFFIILIIIIIISGSHALSCWRHPGRAQRHHFANNLIWRSLSKAGCPSIKEPQGLLRSDGKRPDGLTLIPWQDGRYVAPPDGTSLWPTPSLHHIWAKARRALAQQQKQRPLVKGRNTLTFQRAIPFFRQAFETFGPINNACCDFFSSLGHRHRLFLVSDDPRETSFIFQRLSAAIQIFN